MHGDVRKQFVFADGLDVKVNEFFKTTHGYYRDNMYDVRGEAAKSPLQYVGESLHNNFM